MTLQSDCAMDESAEPAPVVEADVEMDLEEELGRAMDAWLAADADISSSEQDKDNMLTVLQFVEKHVPPTFFWFSVDICLHLFFYLLCRRPVPVRHPRR